MMTKLTAILEETLLEKIPFSSVSFHLSPIQPSPVRSKGKNETCSNR